MMLKTLPRSKTPTGTAYLDRGHGGEVTVLIHGVGMRIEAWEPQIDFIARHHRAIAVDLPGHGDSPPWTDLPVLLNLLPGSTISWTR